MTRRPDFVDPKPVDRSEADRLLASTDPATVARALVGIALHDPDPKWAQERCEGFADHPSPAVRAVVATCIGHIARIHRRIDLASALAVLDRLRSDPDVAGTVEDALDDIDQYVGRAR